MCAACVAQGITYVGGAGGALQAAAYRARRRRVSGARAGTLHFRSHFHGTDTMDVMDAADGKVAAVHDVLDPVDVMDASSI